MNVSDLSWLNSLDPMTRTAVDLCEGWGDGYRYPLSVAADILSELHDRPVSVEEVRGMLRTTRRHSPLTPPSPETDRV